MRLYQVIIFISCTSVLTGSLLIRSENEYKYITKGLYDYYRPSFIAILYTQSNFDDLQEITIMKNIQQYLSEMSIQSIITGISQFIPMVSIHIKNGKKPLIIILSDEFDIKEQLLKILLPIVNISKLRWLVFTQNETSIENFIGNIYIPLDCEFMISKKIDEMEIIMEVYHIEPGRDLQENILATWSSIRGMEISHLNLYQRRGNLQGHILRSAAMHDPPLAVIFHDKNNETYLDGVFGIIMNTMKEMLNFTITYQKVGSYGLRLDNGTWTGGAGALLSNKSDIFSTTLRMARERLSIMDFSTPVYVVKFHLYIKKPTTNSLKWDKYLMPFDIGVWSVIGGLIPFTSVIIILIKHLQKIPTLKEENSRKLSSRIAEMFFNIFGVLCGQSMDILSEDSLRVAQFTIHMTASIILTGYSAILISSLAVSTIVLPFTTMQGLLNDGTYKMGVLKGSLHYTLFRNASDSIMRGLFEKLLSKEIALPASYVEGLNRVCKEDKYTFLATDSSVLQFYYKDCVLIPLDTVITGSYSMGLQRNSPLRIFINRQILLLKESGILMKLLKDAARNIEDGDNTWTSVELIDIMPLIVLLIVTASLSIIIFIGEYMCFYGHQYIFRLSHFRKKYEVLAH